MDSSTELFKINLQLQILQIQIANEFHPEQSLYHINFVPGTTYQHGFNLNNKSKILQNCNHYYQTK